MKYTIELFEAILNKVSDGISLRAACKEAGVSTVTFYEWIGKDETKANKYVRACEVRADVLFEQILEIADDSSKDTVITESGISINNEFVQRSKLKIDARKWYLSKIMPKKYGDKIEQTLVGDSEKPIIINLGSGIDPNKE